MLVKKNSDTMKNSHFENSASVQKYHLLKLQIRLMLNFHNCIMSVK